MFICVYVLCEFLSMNSEYAVVHTRILIGSHRYYEQSCMRFFFCISTIDSWYCIFFSTGITYIKLFNTFIEVYLSVYEREL